MSRLKQPYVQDAFAANWIVPLGSYVDAFEQKFAADFGALCIARIVTNGIADCKARAGWRR
jgi:dTDP-4-amino-4,6-dideoxygalactose transaminase